MNGFRQQQGTSRKERIRELETEIKNLQMAMRISQMMTQQMMQNMKNMTDDLGKALGLINELQYKVLAVQSVANLDVSALNEKANALRLKDFNDASDLEDATQGFTVGDVVKEDSTLIVTSTVDDSVDKGIFRSRFKLADCGVPDMIQGFMGREVGAKGIVKLNGVDHTVEILAIRQPKPEAPVAETVLEAAPQQVVGNA